VLPDRDERARRRGRDDAFHIAVSALAEAAGQADLARFPAGSALAVGTTLGGAIAGQSWHRAQLEGRPGRRRDLLQAPLHAVADHLARRFGLDGPRAVISNACVSSSNALGLALDLIRTGESEVVVAGGVDTLHRFNFSGFAAMGALTGGECRPFDPTRAGMLLGEAAAFLVVESEASARRRGARPLAELAGYGASCDAVHVTAPDREGRGACRAISAALADAGVAPGQIDFVSLHGVGTPFTDGMEAAAMRRVFGERAAQVSSASLRPVTGHTLGSVGAIDSIACIFAIGHATAPPTANHRSLDATLASPLKIFRRARRMPVRIALNTSSGFGGANAAVLFRAWRETG